MLAAPSAYRDLPMSIPAEAFTWAPVSSLEPGRIFTEGGNWYLVVERLDGRPGRHQVLVLTGKLIGGVVELPAHAHVIATAPGFKWRPILDSVPLKGAAEAQPGTLYLGATGPF